MGAEYYNKSVLYGLYRWNILENAEIVNNSSIIIHPGGYAGVQLDTFASGLKQSNFRKVSIEINGDLSEDNNYSNLISCEFNSSYSVSNESLSYAYRSTSINKLTSDYDSVNHKINYSYEFGMPSRDLVGGVIRIINNSDADIEVTQCYMYRSIDINESQVLGSIGLGVSITELKAYLDGCEVYFDGQEDPLKLWWHQDGQGNFDGVNVNNSRFVDFTKINSILTD